MRFDFKGLSKKRKDIILKGFIKKAVSSKHTDIFPLTKEEIINLRINLGISGSQLEIPYWYRYEKHQNLTLDVFKKFIEAIIKDKEKFKNELQSRIKALSNLNNLTHNYRLSFLKDNLITKKPLGNYG